MRTRWVAMVLMLTACGGSVRSGTHEPSGSAGAASGVGGESSSGAASGVGGESSSGAASGVNGEPSSAGFDAGGAGGQPTSPSCVGLDCLAGAELLYQPNRTWHAPAQPVGTSGDLFEADYTPMAGQSITLTFSVYGLQLLMKPAGGGSTVMATRDPTHTDRAWYELALFAGGRFVVQVEDGQLVAEHTIYGSGSPIISSTRGIVKDSP